MGAKIVEKIWKLIRDHVTKFMTHIEVGFDFGAGGKIGAAAKFRAEGGVSAGLVYELDLMDSVEEYLLPFLQDLGTEE